MSGHTRRLIHVWRMDGKCQKCGIDRFGREGLRDGQECFGPPPKWASRGFDFLAVHVAKAEGGSDV